MCSGVRPERFGIMNADKTNVCTRGYQPKSHRRRERVHRATRRHRTEARRELVPKNKRQLAF
jgi:hypothetical protein